MSINKLQINVAIFLIATIVRFTFLASVVIDPRVLIFTYVLGGFLIAFYIVNYKKLIPISNDRLLSDKTFLDLHNQQDISEYIKNFSIACVVLGVGFSLIAEKLSLLSIISNFIFGMIFFSIVEFIRTLIFYINLKGR